MMRSGSPHTVSKWPVTGGVFLALLASTVSGANAHELFPRAPGSAWLYRSEAAGGSSQLSRVVGPMVFAGSPVVELHHSRDLTSWSNYWTVGDSGVRLHGWSQEPDSLAVVYDPPLVWLPVTVEVGATWSSLSMIVDQRTGRVVGEAYLTGMIVDQDIGSGSGSPVDWEVEITVDTRDLVTTAVPSDLLGPLRGLARRGPLAMDLVYRSGTGLVRFPVCCDGTVMTLEQADIGVDLYEASWSAIKRVWRRAAR